MAAVTIESLMADKNGEIWSVTPDATVYEAIQKMEEKEIGALAVIEDQKLVGIISERDYARKVILKGRASRDTAVSEIMTDNVITVSPEQNIEVCMVMMTQQHIRHLPVVQDGQMIGMISLGDVVKAIIKAQQIKIEHLENTISWGESY